MEKPQLMGRDFRFSNFQIMVLIIRFYYQAYVRSNAGGSEKLTPDGSPQWCVRYSPRSAGSFNVTFVITNSSGTFTLKSDTFEASDVNVLLCNQDIVLSKFGVSGGFSWVHKTWNQSNSLSIYKQKVVISFTSIEHPIFEPLAHIFQLERTSVGLEKAKVHMLPLYPYACKRVCFNAKEHMDMMTTLGNWLLMEETMLGYG